MSAPKYREVNEEGIKDFKNLVKELKKNKRIAANKIEITKVVFTEKSSKNSQRPNKPEQEEQLKQSEHEFAQIAPVRNSQPE